MSENSEFEARKQPAPAVEGDSGQYVDGDYGKAGIAREDEKTAVDGEYSEGDYGVAGAVEKQAGAVDGEYSEGDYGVAGAVEKQAGAVEGEYSEGDYGTIGAEEVPEEHRLVEDEVPVEEDADDEDEDLPRDPA
ncbi:hypothetical protein [Arthrobacter oryzae]|uniref:hypothetical protein n=1 Tax=Arthrobacter oryzae TaxID=409290 RepID=UPI00285A81B1|nr:hypothetical protein [Arthrobacter oryzae]MDR6506948.1 hypothetical protein [Arthrobacter oryzae]